MRATGEEEGLAQAVQAVSLALFGLDVFPTAQNETAIAVQHAIVAIAPPFSTEGPSKGRPTNVEISRCPQTCTSISRPPRNRHLGLPRPTPCRRSEVCRTTGRITQAVCQRWLRGLQACSQGPGQAVLARRPTGSLACLLG